MIVGWLDVSYSADYPARLSPSASNICGNSVDTNTKDVILRVITTLIRRWNLVSLSLACVRGSPWAVTTFPRPRCGKGMT